MKIVLDDGAFKPYKAHPEDAGFDLMARECRIVPLQVVDSLDETARGNNGFGSSGR